MPPAEKGRVRGREETLRRFAVFMAGVLVCSVGIALITRAGLGTSPISSIPFVLSLITPVQWGCLPSPSICFFCCARGF